MKSTQISQALANVEGLQAVKGANMSFLRSLKLLKPQLIILIAAAWWPVSPALAFSLTDAIKIVVNPIGFATSAAVQKVTGNNASPVVQLITMR